MSQLHEAIVCIQHTPNRMLSGMLTAFPRQSKAPSPSYMPNHANILTGIPVIMPQLNALTHVPSDHTYICDSHCISHSTG